MAEDGVRNIVATGLDVSKLVTANGAATVTISNVAPTAVGTATVTSWLTVRVQGVDHFIPMWT
jgi:hypothetical protein